MLSHFHKTRLNSLTYSYGNFTPVELLPSVRHFTVQSSLFLTRSSRFEQTLNLNLSFSVLTRLLQPGLLDSCYLFLASSILKTWVISRTNLKKIFFFLQYLWRDGKVDFIYVARAVCSVCIF